MVPFYLHGNSEEQMNDENIIRANEKRTPAERRANAAKAGKASGKARRDKRTFKAIFSEVLDMPIKKGKSTDLDQIRSVADAKGKNLTVQEATALSIAVNALKGDLKAAEFIRDTIGEKPTDAIDIKLPVVIEGEDDFNKLDMSIRGELPDGLFKQITLTFNPWNSTSWLKARFLMLRMKIHSSRRRRGSVMSGSMRLTGICLRSCVIRTRVDIVLRALENGALQKDSFTAISSRENLASTSSENIRQRPSGLTSDTLIRLLLSAVLSTKAAARFISSMISMNQVSQMKR